MIQGVLILYLLSISAGIEYSSMPAVFCFSENTIQQIEGTEENTFIVNPVKFPYKASFVIVDASIFLQIDLEINNFMKINGINIFSENKFKKIRIENGKIQMISPYEKTIFLIINKN